MFIHACQRDSPRTIFPPTQEQFNGLIQYLLSCGEEENPLAQHKGQPTCPLPILPSLQNYWRWDPWDAFACFHIFRDRYERRVSQTKPKQGNRRATDWPEIGDELFLWMAYCDHQAGNPVDESRVAAAREGMKKITPSSPL